MDKGGRRLRNAFGWLVDQFFPSACPLCGKTLLAASSGPFCQACLAGFIPLPPAHCPVCALPFKSRQGSAHLCGRCSKNSPSFTRIAAVGLYEQSLRQAVHLLKFNRRIGLDRPLAGMLAAQLDPEYRPDLIVPVPLHPNRLRQRCYNQAQLLARELATLLDRPLASRLLIKVRETEAQQRLSARERETNLRQAFQLSRQLAGERVLLVDDVMTTGATLLACSRVLMAGGAGEVRGAVVGRAE